MHVEHYRCSATYFNMHATAMRDRVQTARAPSTQPVRPRPGGARRGGGPANRRSKLSGASSLGPHKPPGPPSSFCLSHPHPSQTPAPPSLTPTGCGVPLTWYVADNTQVLEWHDFISMVRCAALLDAAWNTVSRTCIWTRRRPHKSGRYSGCPIKAERRCFAWLLPSGELRRRRQTG